MPRSEAHHCQRPPCQRDTPHPAQDLQRQLNLRLARLDEHHRRGSGGGGVHSPWRSWRSAARPKHRRERQELAAELSERPQQRVRLPGAGRPRTEKRLKVPEEQMQQLNIEQQSVGSQMMRRCGWSVHLSKQWQARLTL